MNNTAAQEAAQKLPDNLMEWFNSGYGVVFVAIVSFFKSLLASWIIEWVKARLVKKVESHKYNLKRAELFFEREVEAASDLVALRERLTPEWTPNRDDWDTACIDFAHNFASVEADLKAYLLKHSVVLSFADRERLNTFIWSAGQQKFELQNLEDEPSATSVAEAGTIMTGLRDLEIVLIGNLKVPHK